MCKSDSCIKPAPTRPVFLENSQCLNVRVALYAIIGMPWFSTKRQYENRALAPLISMMPCSRNWEEEENVKPLNSALLPWFEISMDERMTVEATMSGFCGSVL